MAQGAHLVRELVSRGDIVTSGIASPQTRGVVQIVVLELNKGALARLGHRGAGGAVSSVSRRARSHRAESSVVEMLVHVGVSSPSGSTPGARSRGRSPRHTVRGRGARRTGVARPEWAPQVREVERRRAARAIHLNSNVEAVRGTSRRRRDSKAARSPNLGACRCFRVG